MIIIYLKNSELPTLQHCFWRDTLLDKNLSTTTIMQMALDDKNRWVYKTEPLEKKWVIV